MTDSHIDWLRAERPAPVALDPTTTAAARRRLLEHAAHARRRRWRRQWPLAIAAGAVAAGAGLVIIAPAARVPVTPRPSTAPAVAMRAPSSPLVRLADYIRAGARAPGDATLVLRTQVYPSSPSITGADLYSDSGKYFFSQTLAGLPAAVAADANVGNGFMSRELAAARLAANGNVQSARAQMANATYDNGVKPKPLHGLVPAWVKQKFESLIAATHNPALKQSLRHKLTLLEEGRSLISPQAQADNMVWENSIDTLVAGATDPQVRAGILRLLDTMSEVRVTRTTAAGQPALDIVAGPPALPNDYREELIINANTGVPIRFIGGAPGQVPGVTVTYRVSRVSLAQIAAGHTGP